MTKFRSLLLLLLLSLIINSTASLILNCIFMHDGWDSSISSVYKCEAQPSSLNITTRDATQISSINGRHLSSAYNDEKVNAFRVFNQICHFLPTDLSKFFKNLEGIAIQNSHLKDLTKADLKPFRNLKSLSLYGNDLKSLEFGLFDANLKLEFLSLYSNKIETVGSELLTPLKNLKKAFFHNNLCINKDAVEGDYGNLKKHLIVDCPPTENLIKLQKLDEKLQKIDNDFEKLSSKFFALKDQLSSCEKTNLNLTSSMHNQNSTCVANALLAMDMKKCDGKLRDLTATVMSFEIECVSFDDGVCIADDVITFYEQMRIKGVKFDGRIVAPSEITTLEISGRNFHYMPINFGEFFENIENLTITRTKVSKFDDALENLGKLKILNMAENRMTKITANSLKSLEKLEVFDLSSNEIEGFEESFECLKSLREIYLDENRISTLRWKFFAKNSKIEIISVKSNRLIEIGANLGEIDEITEDFKLSSAFENLKILDLTENVCIDAQHPDKNVSTLVEIFATNCSIFTDIFCDFSQQSTCQAQNLDIDAENTKLRPNFSSNVEIFSADSQSLLFIPQNLQQIFPNLTTVKVNRSKLQKLPKFLNLKEISTVENQIRKLVDENFEQSLLVEVIDLSRNQIASLPHQIFVKLQKLKILRLAGNKIVILQHEIIATKNFIAEFDIARNKLDAIEPEIVKKLKKASFIDFSENSCVDNKFKRGEDVEKKIMEIYGEIVFKCT